MPIESSTALSIEEAKDLISGWASSTEQEFCVGAAESGALYSKLDEVLALIDRLAAEATPTAAPVRDPRRAYRVVDQFEDELCAFTGAPYAVTVDSCTNAIYLSLMYWFARLRIEAEKLDVEFQPTLELPRRTYVGVLQAALNATWRVVWSDEPWTNAYALEPTQVVDSARSLSRGMYGAGDTTCLSFHAAKQLPLGRGGAILTDDPIAVDFFRRSRADGRAPGDAAPYARFPGWHMYMPPDTAARGLWILSRWVDAGYDPPPLPPETYPDLSLIYERNR